MALVVAALALGWVVQKLALTRRGRIVTAAFLCIAGPLLVVLGTLPIFGVVMILGGILLLLGNGRSRGNADGAVRRRDAHGMQTLPSIELGETTNRRISNKELRMAK